MKILVYPANDTSWESLLNYTSAGYSFNSSSGYSYNSTDLNSTTPAENATMATSTLSATPTPTPAPADNSTISVNATGVYPSYNSSSSFDISDIINSTSHLIYYLNGSV